MSFLSFDSLVSVRQWAQDKQIPILSEATAQWLEQHLLKEKPIVCLEIGTAIGVGSRLIAQTIQQRSGYLYSFEISYPSYMIAVPHLITAEVYNCTVYHADLLDAPLNRLLPVPLDFVFIDATKAQYWEYIKYSTTHIRPGGTVVFDDVGMFAHKVDNDSLMQRLTDHNYTFQSHRLADNDSVIVARKS